MQCSIEGCNNPVRARGWCAKHWSRWNRKGNPLVCRPSPTERFWDRVDKNGPIHPIHGRCWTWTGTVTTADGYGQIIANRRLTIAHRYSWILNVGIIPDGLWVLHHCDNPLCVNPAHLFLGNHVDNVTDMVRKGRQVKGERAKFTKLSEWQVLEIRRRYRPKGGNDSGRSLAKEFGVKPDTIIDIVNRHTWKHL